jgi:tetratricopeptide (TPR) repeat protein
MGRIDEAIADFDRTIEINPRYANAYFNRGELLISRDQVQEAMRDYEQAIELGPTDAAMYNSLGMAYSKLRQTGDALREFSRAVELEATYAPALVNRGEAYVALGRYGDAAADFRAAITADPNLAKAYQAAAWLMATCPDGHYRDEKLAIEAANKALELEGENYRNLETLAAAQASAGQHADAKATQEKAIASVPRDQLVEAEKRMAMYQKELAYREVSRQDLIAAKQARQEEAAEKRRFPVQQATAEEPVDPALDEPEQVRYPEDELGYDASMEQATVPAPKKRGFLPQQFNPFSRSRQAQQQQQSQPRNLPKKPNRTRQQAIRPF